MPNEFELIDRGWPRRRALWVSHYIAKGCSRRKADECAARKRFKQSTPHLMEPPHEAK
jgi:hypothetical protein